MSSSSPQQIVEWVGLVLQSIFISLMGQGYFGGFRAEQGWVGVVTPKLGEGNLGPINFSLCIGRILLIPVHWKLTFSSMGGRVTAVEQGAMEMTFGTGIPLSFHSDLLSGGHVRFISVTCPFFNKLGLSRMWGHLQAV